MQYRVIVEYDEDGQSNQDGADGNPLPESREFYEDNQYQKDGKTVPYEEYVAYYGDPNRHTIMMFKIQQKCGECGQWKTIDSLYGIDFMDDSEDANRAGTYSIDEVRDWPADSYLRSEILETLPFAVLK